jgi:diguanylate cyclase (GGDEF)-like protein/PAS domain S-box-containing protein
MSPKSPAPIMRVMAEHKRLILSGILVANGFSLICVSGMSLYFFGFIREDYLVTGIVTASLASLFVIPHMLQQSVLLEQQKRQLALDETHRHILDSIGEGLYVVDMHFNTTFVNAAFLRMLGYPDDERFIGNDVHPIIHHSAPDGSPIQTEYCRIFQAFREGRKGHGDDEVFWRADGTSFPVEYWSYPQLKDGRLIGGVVTFVDISERKRLEQALAGSEQRYRTVFESAADAAFIMDGEVFIDCNAAAAAMFRCPVTQITGKTPYDFSPPTQPDGKASKEAALEKITNAMQSLHPYFEWVHQRADGETFFAEVGLNTLSIRDKTYLVAFVRDVTQRKKAEESMLLAAQVYQNSSEAMMVTDASGSIVNINPAFTTITGYAPEEIIGQNSRVLRSSRHDQEFYRQMWHDILTTGHWEGEVWNRRKDGAVYPEWLSINTIFNPDGSIFRCVALFSDITRRKEAERMIWEQANFDPLTRLPNRYRFHDRLNQEIKKSHRTGQPIAVIFIDLDRFKEVNDTLGHSMGDMLLKEAAQRLAGCVRETDTVARLGGDEFTIILSELDEPASVDRISQNILKQMAEPFRLGDEVAYVSASIGITFYPMDASNSDALLKNADQAMYLAKNTGRNRYNYFTPSMQEAAQARMQLSNDLRLALAGNQFELYYQPIVDLATGAVDKAEALIRWHHPTRGMVSPAEFIPIAEDTEIIVEIGNWVFQEAARQVALWRAGYNQSFQISVNKSPVQFYYDGEHHTHAAWFEYLRALGLPGQSVVVEITEGVLMDASDPINDQLVEFHKNGMEVSLDDFGTGYSSLSYLKKFDISYIKIDQSFTRNLETESDDMGLCEAIIVMGHKLRMKVIAEGVETEEHRRLLMDAGCDYAQGYLFSRPVPAAEFEKLLAGHTIPSATR